MYYYIPETAIIQFALVKMLALLWKTVKESITDDQAATYHA